MLDCVLHHAVHLVQVAALRDVPEDRVAALGHREVEVTHGLVGLRSAQVRAEDDRALCLYMGTPYRKRLCPVVLCPYLCSSDGQRPPHRLGLRRERQLLEEVDRLGVLVDVVVYVWVLYVCLMCFIVFWF